MLQARYTTSPWPVSNNYITYGQRTVRNVHCATLLHIDERFIIKDYVIAFTYGYVIISKIGWYLIIYQVNKLIRWLRSGRSLEQTLILHAIYIYISTHLPLDKMAAISETMFQKFFFMNVHEFRLKYQKCVDMGLIGSKSALVHVIVAWCRPGNDNPVHRRIYATLRGDELKLQT